MHLNAIVNRSYAQQETKLQFYQATQAWGEGNMSKWIWRLFCLDYNSLWESCTNPNDPWYYRKEERVRDF